MASLAAESKPCDEASEAWDDGDFEFGTEGSGDDEDSAFKDGFSDSDNDDEDWDMLCEPDELDHGSVASPPASETQSDTSECSPSAVSSSLSRLRDIFSSEGNDSAKEENLPLLSVLQEREDEFVSQKKKMLEPGEIPENDLTDRTQFLMFQLQDLRKGRGAAGSTSSSEGALCQTLKELALVSYEARDYKRSVSYFIELLGKYTLEKNRNEFMYIVEAIAKIRSYQGNFSAGEEELKKLISKLRRVHQKVKRNANDDMDDVLESRSLMECIQTLEITRARLCMDGGLPEHAAHILLSVACSIDLDNAADTDNGDLKLDIVLLWLAKAYLEAEAPSRCISVLNRIKFVREKVGNISTRRRRRRRALTAMLFQSLFEPCDPPDYSLLVVRYRVLVKDFRGALCCFAALKLLRKESARQEIAELQNTEEDTSVGFDVQQETLAGGFELEGNILAQTTLYGTVHAKFPMVIKPDLSAVRVDTRAEGDEGIDRSEREKREERAIKQESYTVKNCAAAVRMCVAKYQRAYDTHTSLGDHKRAMDMALAIARVQTAALFDAVLPCMVQNYEQREQMDGSPESPIDILNSIGTVTNNFDDIEHPAIFAYNRSRQMGLPLKNIECALVLAEYEYLRGNEGGKSEAFWKEAYELFSYLFIDGATVPILLQSPKSLTQRIMRVFSRIIMLFFALPLPLENPCLYLLDVYIHAQYDVRRRTDFQAISETLPVVFQYHKQRSIKFRGRSASGDKNSDRASYNRWDSFVKNADGEAVSSEFCYGCLLKIERASSILSKTNAPKEIYNATKWDRMEWAHAMVWKRNRSGQPQRDELGYQDVLAKAVNKSTGNRILAERLLRLIYLLKVDNFVFSYSPHTGFRQILLSTGKGSSISLKSASSFGSTASLPLSSDATENGALSSSDAAIPYVHKLSLRGDVRKSLIRRIMGSARKHRQWKRSNSVTELSGARSEIVKDRGSTENTGGGDSSNEHPSEDREMLTPIQILCNSLKIAELVGGVVHSAEDFQKQHDIHVRGTDVAEAPSEQKKLGFFSSVFSRRVKVSNEIRSLKPAKAPVTFVVSPALSIIPFEDALIHVGEDSYRSPSLLFSAIVSLSGVQTKTGNSRPSRTVSTRLKRLPKVPSFIAFCYKTRRPLRMFVTEEIRKRKMLRRMFFELNHLVQKSNPMNPEPTEIDGPPIQTRRIFEEKRVFFSFLGRKSRPLEEFAPFQSPLVTHGHPQKHMNNSLPGLFEFVNGPNKLKDAAEIVSLLDGPTSVEGRVPVLLLTFADLLEAGEPLLHIMGFRPDVRILYVAHQHYEKVSKFLIKVFVTAKKCTDRDEIVLKKEKEKLQKNAKSSGENRPKKDGDGDDAENPADADGIIRQKLNLPEEWASLDAILQSSRQVLMKKYSISTILQGPWEG